MLIDRQFEKVLAKTKTMETTYSGYEFKTIGEVAMQLYVTREHLRRPPQDAAYRPVALGESWGGEYQNGWFRGRVSIDEELSGKPLYLTARTGAVESLLFINGISRGIYAEKFKIKSRGTHHTLLLTRGEEAGRSIDIDIEGYCGHNVPGTQPFNTGDYSDRRAVYNGVYLKEMRREVKDFVLELQILNQLAERLPDNFRLAQIQNCLLEVYNIVPQKPEEYEEEEWLEKIVQARRIMRPVLNAHNSGSAPFVGLIGHSHIDTAWQWTVDETIRKCARTYSNVLSLMDQYPEFTFIQSSAYHGELMRREYPDVFEGIKRRVAEGRYEPNGGVWVECDCNLVSGESLIRQFLWGQRWTKTYYNYESDTFWLPDTFGYSAAIPQIMKGCHIRYFLTTKLAGNDTNVFPYDTFYWRGMDGTEVLAHFNLMSSPPDPATLIGSVMGDVKDPGSAKRAIRFKRVNNCRLVSYGLGDGGGGPTQDDIEIALKLGDVEGCPKSCHMTVSRFMKRLEETSRDIPVYSGELYFEMHRGTLTSKHEIKRNNRLAEIALHDLEFAAAMAYLSHRPYPKTDALFETLLVNQFHDILPGTSIPQVNERTQREVGAVIQKARDAFDAVIASGERKDGIALVNTLSWSRGAAYLPLSGRKPEGSAAQAVTDVTGGKKLYAERLNLPGLSSGYFMTVPLEAEGPSPFVYDGSTLSTPCLLAAFDENGGISSLIDRASGRELRKAGGYPLNTFLFGEDVPMAWDNWDIDIDTLNKLEPAARLLSREVAADGPLQFRLRSVYALGKASTITQDMVFYASTPRVDFETLIDWNETHKLLKAGFDLDIVTDQARHEIQFGHVFRPTYKRNVFEQAMFEVCNHKYTDLSEPRFGVAILNDCKYGISVDGTFAALSLMKGGMHPDTTADSGRHLMTYALLPHGGFSAENVVRPAYEFNVPVRCVANPAVFLPAPLAAVSAGNVIIETVKVAEDGDGVILRLYECEKSGCEAAVSLGFDHSRVYETDMLEQDMRELKEDEDGVRLRFRAFEIKTLKVVR